MLPRWYPDDDARSAAEPMMARGAVVELIYSRPDSDVTSFSEAFRLGKRRGTPRWPSPCTSSARSRASCARSCSCAPSTARASRGTRRPRSRRRRARPSPPPAPFSASASPSVAGIEPHAPARHDRELQRRVLADARRAVTGELVRASRRACTWPPEAVPLPGGEGALRAPAPTRRATTAVDGAARVQPARSHLGWPDDAVERLGGCLLERFGWVRDDARRRGRLTCAPRSPSFEQIRAATPTRSGCPNQPTARASRELGSKRAGRTGRDPTPRRRARAGAGIRTRRTSSVEAGGGAVGRELAANEREAGGIAERDERLRRDRGERVVWIVDEHAAQHGRRRLLLGERGPAAPRRRGPGRRRSGWPSSRDARRRTTPGAGAASAPIGAAAQGRGAASSGEALEERGAYPRALLARASARLHASRILGAQWDRRAPARPCPRRRRPARSRARA